jgi:hypothetical protein
MSKQFADFASAASCAVTEHNNVGLTVSVTSTADRTATGNELGMDSYEKGLDVEIVYDDLLK